MGSKILDDVSGSSARVSLFTKDVEILIAFCLDILTFNSIAWCRASIRRYYLQRNNRLVAIELRLTCAHIYLQSDNTRHRVTRRWYAGWRRYAADY